MDDGLEEEKANGYFIPDRPKLWSLPSTQFGKPSRLIENESYTIRDAWQRFGGVGRVGGGEEGVYIWADWKLSPSAASSSSSWVVYAKMAGVGNGAVR